MSETLLPTIERVPASRPVAGPTPEWLEAAARARLLSWISLVWMSLEGGIAITAGIVAGSVALIGFGIDSFIEGVASVVIIWRFSGARMHSPSAESRAQKLVAAQFFLLAPYVAYEATKALTNAEHPDVSAIGLVLTASSVIGMPLLGVAKQRVARKVSSQATHGEGTQNLLCAYLAAAVFLGLAGNALFGWWWLDPLAALAIASVALREGVQTWNGEGCCAGPDLSGSPPGYADECCSP